MEAKRAERRGRPSKGERHSFAVKLDLARAAKLQAIKETTGVDYVDYLTPIVAPYLDSIDLSMVRGQEALPIDKAS